eukprot:s1733_g8.t1
MWSIRQSQPPADNEPPTGSSSGLRKIYHSYLKAWRFQEGASRVLFHNDLAGAWRFLTAGSTYLTLHDIDPDSAELISKFQSFADEQFGGMMSAFKLFDLDKNGYVDVTEFTRVLIGFGYPGSQVKALFNCLDVDGNCRLSRRNLTFIDDWARECEEKVDESQIMVVQATQKVSKQEKKIEISPRLIKLSDPRVIGPREAPTVEATRAMRIAALEDEILKSKGDLVDPEDAAQGMLSLLDLIEDEQSESSGYYDYSAVKLKSQALRHRTVKLLERLQDSSGGHVEDSKATAKAVKLPSLGLLKEGRAEQLEGHIPKKKRSPYDLRARGSLLRVLDTIEPGEAREHTLQALAWLQQTTTQCGHPPYQHTPPPNPHQVAAALTGVILECAHHMMETTGPHRAPVEDLLPDVRELCALVKEGAHLFHDMRWAREWAQVHRGEDLAARAEELCEHTLNQLEDTTNYNEDTLDNVYLQLAEVETLVQEAAEAHTHAWGHPTEESQDETKAANLLREEHQADVIHQDGGTSSQPSGLVSAQPQLPLRALRTLRTLEPFLAAEARELLLQAMGDLSSWSTQFWGHPVVVVADDDHTQA